ncbi:protein phosphatase 2C 57, partial [Tanacetum coccineum]
MILVFAGKARRKSFPAAASGGRRRGDRVESEGGGSVFGLRREKLRPEKFSASGGEWWAGGGGLLAGDESVGKESLDCCVSDFDELIDVLDCCVSDFDELIDVLDCCISDFAELVDVLGSLYIVALGSAKLQCAREEMEDDAVIVSNNDLDGFFFAVVFDGHAGFSSVKFLREELYKKCAKSLQLGQLLNNKDYKGIEIALQEAFENADAKHLN